MRIDRIQRERTPGRSVSLIFDDGSTLSLSKEVYMRSRLARGDSLTRNDFLRLEDEELQYSIRKAALRFLSLRPRSAAELRQYLKRKKFPETAAEVVSQEFRKMGMVDDERYAGMVVRDTVMRGRSGPGAIRRKLAQGGVAKETAERAISAHFPRDTQLAQAEKLLKRRLERSRRTLAKLRPDQRRARLYSFLAQRGFSHETVSRALRIVDVRGTRDQEQRE